MVGTVPWGKGVSPPSSKLDFLDPVSHVLNHISEVPLGGKGNVSCIRFL